MALFLAACKSPDTTGGASPGQGLKYARHFSLEAAGDFTLIRVYDPWQNSRDLSFDYVLGRDPSGLPDSLSSLPFVRIPVSRVLTMSTTHLAPILALGKGESVRGLSGAAFVYDSLLRRGIDSGRIRDVGYGQGLNYEGIVQTDPGVMFMYGVDGSISSTVAKLEELGIPVVYCADYLEQDPLAKAEWIRFFAAFFGEEKRAERWMDSISDRYSALVKLATGADSRPGVLTGLPWKDTWYMAGGKSFAARLISDSGGDYLWGDDLSAEAVPLDLETVYARAVEADIWINPGAAASLEDICSYDRRFAELPVVGSGKVYNNDLRKSPGGGNDYWESGVSSPDRILADLIAIFHPELLEDHRFSYYRRLK